MTQSLFREEVLEAQRDQFLGTIRIGRPLSFTLVTTTSLAMAAALVAFAYWGEVARKATVPGVLLPVGGLINISAPQAGVLAQVLVQEGDIVEAGQPIARLRNDRITATGDAAAINAQALQARRDSLSTEHRLTEQGLRQRQESIAQRLQNLQAEERQAQSELETSRLRVQLAVKSLERQQDLAKGGFVAAAQVQAKQEDLLDLQLRQRSAERSLQGLWRDLETTKADKLSAETQAKTTLTQLARALAALDQEVTENDSRNGLTLTAPQAARVSALTLNTGQAVQAGQTVASLMPSPKNGNSNLAELQAQLFAPSRTAGFVQKGQAVYLRYAAFPYQKFGMARGDVVAVSRSPIAPQDLPVGQSQALLTAAQANEPMYRITVRLFAQSINTYDKQTPLAAGMSLDADIRQESRKVWEWLLEPALAVAGGKKNVGEEPKSN
ncbi:HlyD family secretion protein [Roseateles saccharophilus]|uniref:Membrane fusion protein n=1 Tax=Roseateles saccharophilus TaxID=304 RepID=A0A4R3U6T7_ROSSA|nr:HlyD family efflux transporter periplasmic adaptor subunit [Roseateles saccharophilus]MDG0836230.1 HlyD family efflux transporter periplasmic adaptor subunit [Roseateles saccharophilus]TCU81352.1 membrane fusion protein [Roseateles saccharophilus]